MSRISLAFDRLKAEGRTGLIAYVIAGDPDNVTSRAMIAALPAAGVDIIEIGIPFTDPMADGPTIQAGHIRALSNGTTLADTLSIVRDFRGKNTTTPIVLMGYYNPVYRYGAERFARDAAAAGVDGVLMVDLPPEEDDELKPVLKASGIDLIRLITPTSDEARLKTLVKDASGFLYYVSIAGVTGTTAINKDDVAEQIQKIRAVTDMPIAVGFGIRTRDDVNHIAPIADAVVIGSAFVNTIATTDKTNVIDTITAQVKSLHP